jgi:transcriptional repressor NrdR
VKCPFCGYEDSKVIDSRPSEDNGSIRRRRECLKCEKRFTTFEKIDELPITVVKKNNEREPFSPAKLQAGLLRATIKRQVSRETLEKMTTDIENDIRNSFRQEVPADEIGEMAMAKLKEIDTVAYVRFASVYRDFKNVDEFVREIEKVRNARQVSGRTGSARQGGKAR